MHWYLITAFDGKNQNRRTAKDARNIGDLCYALSNDGFILIQSYLTEGKTAVPKGEIALFKAFVVSIEELKGPDADFQINAG